MENLDFKKVTIAVAIIFFFLGGLTGCIILATSYFMAWQSVQAYMVKLFLVTVYPKTLYLGICLIFSILIVLIVSWGIRKLRNAWAVKKVRGQAEEIIDNAYKKGDKHIFEAKEEAKKIIGEADQIRDGVATEIITTRTDLANQQMMQAYKLKEKNLYGQLVKKQSELETEFKNRNIKRNEMIKALEAKVIKFENKNKRLRRSTK